MTTITEVIDGSARWTVVHGECLSVMATMPDRSVAHVITDPPYGLGFRGMEWDEAIPDWLPDARRIAPAVLFTTAPTTLWDYPRPDWVVCWARPASNARTKQGGFSWWSPVLVYGATKFPIDFVSLHAIQHSAPRDVDHPSPKPLALMLWLLGHATKEDDLVLDPFCGSGTTGLACLRLGRRFIGIEQNETYATLARDRLTAEEQGSTLQAARAGQSSLFGGRQ